MTAGLLLAHAGPGSTWQAMVVVAGVVLAGFVLAAALGRLPIDSPDDLVVPLASTAIVSSFGTLAHEWLSDAVGWGLPLAVVTLLALVLAAVTDLDIRFPEPLPMGALALAAVSSVVLYGPLTIALHPPVELLPLSDDATVSILAPADGAELSEGPVEVVVEVTGGSLGPGDLPLEELPDDPEEAGALSVAIERVDQDPAAPPRSVDADHADCSIDDPCRQVAFALDPGPGTHELTVEFVRGDGVPLAPFVRERVTFTVE